MMPKTVEVTCEECGASKIEPEFGDMHFLTDGLCDECDDHDLFFISQSGKLWIQGNEENTEWDWALIIFGGIGLFMLLWLLGVR